MTTKRLLLGDEAFAQGAIDAGLSGAYAYPGTPSTEILEYVQQSPIARERKLHSHWSSNEKTAMEEAMGMSFCGKRATVSMKHVGLNVAADPFVNSAMTGANGGLLVVGADDPSMHSSQNEQDSRFYAKFALLPCLEPSDQQEAYDMAGYGFRLSEEFGVPVLFRLVTRLSHSRGVVEVATEPQPENKLHYPGDANQWVLMPVNSRKRYKELIKIYARLEEAAEKSPFNSYTDAPDHSLGVIVSGLAYNYFKEVFPEGIPFPTLKISQYPLPVNLVRRLSDECKELLIIEEGMPVIEEMVRGALDLRRDVYGKLDGILPRTGELTPDDVRKGLLKLRPNMTLLH